VSMDEEVRVTIPIALVGTPIGAVNGGNLHQNLHSVPVAAKPSAIPNKIEIDVTGLDVGDALHISDVKLPAGIRILLDPKEGVASVVMPRAEKEVAPVAAAAEGAAAAPAEGAAAAPADGKAPAGGDKGGAAPAAKKEGGEKKGK
jgi:large subunit ribosomal protein L25